MVGVVEGLVRKEQYLPLSGAASLGVLGLDVQVALLERHLTLDCHGGINRATPVAQLPSPPTSLPTTGDPEGDLQAVHSVSCDQLGVFHLCLRRHLVSLGVISTG